MSREEITRDQRLKIAIQDLAYAAAPTKSEVFVVCGGKAAELRDDLTALLAENERLRGALTSLFPPGGKVEERVGWHGTSAVDPTRIYACEFCRAEHEDFTLTQHAERCPVTVCRAALNKDPDQ